MQLNPFIEQVSQLEVQRKRLVEQDVAVSKDINWVDSFDIELAAADSDQIADAQKIIDRNITAARQLGDGLAAELKRRVGYREEIMRKHAAKLVQHSEMMPSALNPLGWFSGDRATYSTQLRAAQLQMAYEDRALTESIREADEARQRHEAHAARMRLEASQLSAEQAHVTDLIGRYQATSQEHMRSVLSETRAQLEGVVRKLADAMQQRDNVEAQIKGVRRDIEIAASRKTHLESRVARASGFEARLAHASKSDRWMIHRECEDALGESSPISVKRAASREVKQIERDLAKLHQRAGQIVKDASRLVHTVIFDGNNLCYSGGKFIGIGALQAAASFLSLSKKVVVIFDRSITQRLDASASAIQGMFKLGIEVHVVQGRRTADETVLNAASDETSVVISNDRFAEFLDKAATRDGRVLIHEIVNGHVSIPQLGISERFV